MEVCITLYSSCTFRSGNNCCLSTHRNSLQLLQMPSQRFKKTKVVRPLVANPCDPNVVGVPMQLIDCQIL